MQAASTTLAPVPLAPVPMSNISDRQIVTGQNGDSFSEVNPVNLAGYANRFQKSGIDILYYDPSETASYSGYSQNRDGTSKFNSPMDLAVSAPRDPSQRSELPTSNDPVNLAAYARKQPDYGSPSNLSINEIPDVSVRSSSESKPPLASLPPNAVQTVSTDIKDEGTSSASVQPSTYQNNPALIRSVAAASSQQTGGYPHNVGLRHSVPPSYHSAEWRPLLSPRTAQLVVNAVSTSGQPSRTDATPKEGERNPLLLQLQVCHPLKVVHFVRLAASLK